MRANLKTRAIVFVLVTCVSVFAPAAMLSPGDVVVASIGELSDEGDGVIFKVDPTTGDRTIISAVGVGSGLGFDPFGVAVATSHDIFFTDHANPSVFHVDVSTGNRQVIASSTIGTGPVIQSPHDIVVRGDGNLVVADGSGNSLLLVNPVTLERTIVSGSGVGVGPDILNPVGMTLDANGDILVTLVAPFDQPSTLIKVDALTGDREIISADGVGNGPVPDFWSDVVVDGDSGVLVTNFDGLSPIRGVFTVDPTTGDRAVVSALGTGAGPTLIQPLGIAVETNGNILVTNESFPVEDSLIRIDSATGDRTIVSGIGVGSGPALLNPQLLDIVPVPEPSTIVLLGTGILLLLTARGRHRAASR